MTDDNVVFVMKNMKHISDNSNAKTVLETFGTSAIVQLRDQVGIGRSRPSVADATMEARKPTWVWHYWRG